MRHWYLLVLTLYALTSTAADELVARWSTAGPLSGEFAHCLLIDEPANPDNAPWRDNYLCFNRSDHGFSYSYAGATGPGHCESLNIKGGAWQDNFLCSASVAFAWFPRALKGGYRCIRIIEPADADPRGNGSQGYSNHFCLKN